MKTFLFLLSAVLLASCSTKKQADLLVFNARVYTVDDQFSVAEAFAVADGKILEVGKSDDLKRKYESKELLDAEGKSIYPGFIDGHAHFYRYGEGLQNADLVGTQSWEEILEKLKVYAVENKEGWIIGRGWDQNDWSEKNFPSNEKLNELFPNRPVVLTRIDGHAIIANQAALSLGNVKPGQKMEGGNIEMVNGKLTGILIDNAQNLIYSKILGSNATQSREALLDAQKNCFAVGLTSVVDCGLDFPTVDIIDNLQKSNDLKMRIYVMLSDDSLNYNYLFKKGAVKTDRLNVRSFKVYADGALGSRGACMLKPYTDKPNQTGFLLSSSNHYENVARKIYDKGFQMNTHAIGDSANREILKIYSRILNGKNDLRWRIEHAQVLSPDDFKLFGENNIIPSVQSTHATSDMYWAGDRIGAERLKSAYAYKQLLQQNGWLVLGTDFPVENIDPMLTFYAATVRKDSKGFPDKGFQMENALSREEALRGMTIWAAKGSFEEKEKGSIEAGKFADFIIMDQDILKVEDSKLLNSKILKTFVNGENVFSK
ncbi:amidohydrolase [Daejeonella oryzae]|uniref:amidohydrolase n=1 Tax=Daejeonella oryzae TaxID=1122943 RepID=UPI00040DCB6E|nr:amidohydrolase [Daejeonella oryzae]